MIRRNIEQIKKAQRDGRLTIFVGAGVSRSSDPTAPTWNDLINSLKSDLGVDYESDYLKIAQLYYNEFGEYALYEKLKSLISSDLEPSPIHELILKINPQYIITTNWDSVLEKELLNSLSLYEKIASDKDLSKSLSAKKLIKMHGDFANHNIVFKEDDYLAYEHNFPLINNYIKGILTTNTVVFIGYSYNDINLKRIMSWIKIRSDSMPPMFMLQSVEDKAQIKYLEKHGISTIVLPNPRVTLFSDDRSNALYSFLEDVINLPSFNKDEESPIDAIYDKLCGLQYLPYLLQSQVCSALGNCSYKYDGSQAFLIFHKDILSSDFDPSERLLNYLFVEKINDYENEKLSSNEKTKMELIFGILKKAGISGVRAGAESHNKYIYFEDLPDIPPMILERFSFVENYTGAIGTSANSASYAAIRLTEIDDMTPAVEILENAMRQAISKRQPENVLILSKNYQHLSFLIKRENLQETTSLKKNYSKFKDARSYFNDLSLDQRNKIKLIMESLDQNFVKSLIFNALSDLNKQREAFDVIMGEGAVFNGQSPGISATHKNVLFYFIGNSLFDVFNKDFSELNKIYLEASFLHKIIQTNEINPEKHELFALIAFYKLNRLKSFFSKLMLHEGKIKYSFKITDTDSKWIIEEVIKNIIACREKTKKVNDLELLLGNAFYILSLTSLSGAQYQDVISLLLQLLKQGRSSILNYEMLSQFIANQYVFYSVHPDSDKLQSIFETIFAKFINETANGYDSIAVGENYIANIYNIAKLKDLKLKKTKSLELLLVSLKNSSFKYQYEFCSNVLLDIYVISDADLTALLKAYFNKLRSSVKSNIEISAVYFNILMISNGVFKNGNRDIKLFEDFLLKKPILEGYEAIKFERSVNFLASEKDITEYKKIYERFFHERNIGV